MSPLTCVVGLDWQGAVVKAMPLLPVVEDGVLRFEHHEDGRPARVAVHADPGSFADAWIESVESGSGSPIGVLSAASAALWSPFDAPQG